MSERRPATTIGELDIHLGNVQDGLSELRNAIALMATREDIASITRRLDGFATKEELKAAEERLAHQSVPTVAKRIGQVLIFLAACLAAVVALAGAAAAMVHFFDKLPK